MKKPAPCCLIICMWIMFIDIMIPILLTIFIITLPCKFVMMCRRPKLESKINVKVVEPEGGASEDKDELLFVHGWPDCGDMWNE